MNRIIQPNSGPPPQPQPTVVVTMTVNVLTGDVAVKTDPPQADILLLAQACLGVAMQYLSKVRELSSMLVNPNKPEKGNSP